MTEKAKPIIVPDYILEGLEAVRRSGFTNMLDRPRVIELARMFGYEDTAEWIENNKRQYAEGIFIGFTSDEEAC